MFDKGFYHEKMVWVFFVHFKTNCLFTTIEMKEKKLGILIFSDKNPLEKANFLIESK